MQNTLENNSGILLIKSKFFLYRVVSYFSFLLIPVWVQKSLDLNYALQSLIMLLYILFMVSQWFFLGKEIDHRLKIYFRVNSSIDRVVYRLFLGMCFFILYFNLLNFLPPKWIYNSFWITWVILGLFYSWPTRGKIIRESVTSNFGEFRYLDSFEKTLVGLSILTFIFSIPELPSLTGKEALMLFFDPAENFSPQLWEFLKINYYPFFKYPRLFKVAWCMHFYFVGIGFFLLAFYALLRFFVSRRLSLLGIFALISSWSFTKILAVHYGYALSTTYSLVWIWTLLWVTKSSTYRAGLFLGLINYFGVLLNPVYSFLIIIQLLLTHFYFLKEKTDWFKRQLIKYSSFGLALIILTAITHLDYFEHMSHLTLDYLSEAAIIINRKAFNALALFGLIILALKFLMPKANIIEKFKLDIQKTYQIGLLLVILLVYSIAFEADLINGFTIMWPVVVLALIPLELLFQTLSRLRSSRNMIYLIYILICLLDSHFEGRVKIFLRLFNN